MLKLNLIQLMIKSRKRSFHAIIVAKTFPSSNYCRYVCLSNIYNHEVMVMEYRFWVDFCLKVTRNEAAVQTIYLKFLVIILGVLSKDKNGLV